MLLTVLLWIEGVYSSYLIDRMLLSLIYSSLSDAVKRERPYLYFVFPFRTHPLQWIFEHLKLQLTDPSLVRSQYQSVKTLVSLSRLRL